MDFSWLKLCLLVANLVIVADSQLWVNITLLDHAVEEGAVCLDGSPPAYHFDPGTGSGSKSWVVFLEGGGWCSSFQSCLDRSRTRLGSSVYMEKRSYFDGILSNSPDLNPDFYNWNRVNVRYCDGASFAGNVDEPTSQAPVLMFRGMKIWRAIVKELLSKGMDSAEMALLTGCSAGGLAAILHCNDFRQLLPERTKMKCVSDAGFFVDAKDVSGNYSFRSYYKNVVSLHNVLKQLPEGCTSKLDAQCYFPQHVLPYITAPLLLVNPAYDVWQIQNILVPNVADPQKTWDSCKMSPPNCSASQMEVIQEFRTDFLDASNYEKLPDEWGFYFNSCFTHCQTENKEWNLSKTAGKTVREAVGDWYFNRSQVKLVDCAYPCNPSCMRWPGWR